MSPPNLYLETLMSEVMVLGSETFGKWLGDEDRAITNGISAPIKEASESSLAPSTLRWHSGKSAVYSQE